MADITVQPDRPSGRSTTEIVVDRIWRFFTSVRNAVIEIIWLTLLVLIGTLRGSSAPQWLKDRVPATGWLVDRWYRWDVYHSWVFAATLGLIAVAIIICTLNRVPGIWTTITRPNVPTTLSYLRGAETNALYSVAMSPADAEAALSSQLRGRRYRVLTAELPAARHLYADRNRWSNLGTFPFHLGLILILVGGIVASTFGFRDPELVIPEGERRNVGHGTGLSVELNRFRDSWTENGIAQEYRSDLTVYSNGNQIGSGSATVNHPLSVRNATFYQSSFGNAAQMQITDANGTMVYADAVDMGLFNQSRNPDAPAGIIRLPNQNLQLVVIGPDTDPANEPELDTLKLKTGQLWILSVPLDGHVTPAAGGGMGGVIVTQGTPSKVGNLNVLFQRETRFTVLQVGYNPALPIFLIALFWLLGGLMITFYFPHRRIRAMITPSSGGSDILLAPMARRDWGGKREFMRLVEHLNGAWSVKPELKLPPNSSDYEHLSRDEQW